jgi:phage N-6-adenine-methyltransferase
MVQGKLADEVGLKRTTVIAAENGDCTAETYFALINHLGYEIRGGRRLPPGVEIGHRLGELRKLRKESRAAVAHLAHVDHLTARAIEEGRYGYLRPLEAVGIAVGAGLRLVKKETPESPWLGALTSSESVEWNTPPEFLDLLYPLVGGGFACDPCSPRNDGPTKALVHFTAEDDGLTLEWPPGAIWVNPPYARGLTGQWVARCREQAEISGGPIFVLIPARTDTAWWHDHVADHGHVVFLRGRLAFGGGGNSAPFASALVVCGADEALVVGLRQVLLEAWHVPAVSGMADVAMAAD